MPSSKKNAAGCGTIRKKTVTKNGKDYTYWEARYTMGYDPGTGKQIQKSITGKTQSEVAKKLKEATAALDAGTYIAPQAAYRAFKLVVTDLGMPQIRFHDLRHSYAVASLRSGDDAKTVQENLGHATAAFTLDVYGHVTEQMKTESANRMEAFIQSVSA